jgi:branched-chain amino acid aminotransferase
MHKFIYQNQRLTTQTQAKISINERGYLFGDGIFETCLIQNHHICDFDRHIKRLKFGLKSLKINCDITNLNRQCQTLITKNKVQNGILKIQISRGQGSLGYLPKHNDKPLLIITTQNKRPRPKYISLGISPYQTPNHYFGKTTNSLPYILSKITAKENNHFDTILCDKDQNIAETSSANIFWVNDNHIFTPPTSTNLIPGTKREKILEISPINITEKSAKIETLNEADEIFLSNSAHLILPVHRFNNRELKTDISKKLLNILRDSCEQ